MAAAAAPSVALTGVVLEPLSRDNYEDWSTLVKNYLAGQDLWDNIVEGDIITDNEQNQVWKLKNSRALHVIQLSCGNPSLAYVRHCKTAEEAWNILSVLFDGGRDLRSHIDDIEQGVHGSDDEMGLLHFAVATEQEEILNELFKTVDPSWLKLTDNQGNTLLALAAELTDNVNMAKIMVSTGGEDLLSDMNRKGEIPVLIASANGRKKLTRYLFSVTPVSVLVGDNYRYASLLFSRCISAEILDVAVALLQQHENALNLAIIDESNSGWSPIYALASIPSAFRSGILLGLIRKAFYESMFTFYLGSDTNKSIYT